MHHPRSAVMWLSATAFMGMKPTPLISTFFRLETFTHLSLSYIQRERPFKTDQLCQAVLKLHPVIDHTFEKSRALEHMLREKKKLPNSSVGDWVLFVRNDFSAKENFFFPLA